MLFCQASSDTAQMSEEMCHHVTDRFSTQSLFTSDEKSSFYFWEEVGVQAFPFGFSDTTVASRGRVTQLLLAT